VIQKDSDCDFDIDDFRPRAISAMIAALSDSAQAADQEAAMKFATENLEIAGNWALAEQLGDYFASVGQRRAKAMEWYERGLNMAKSHPAIQISAADWTKLEKKAAAEKMMASNDDEGRKPASFAASQRDIEGNVGGVLAPPPPSVRGAEAAAVPLPINFVFGQATFTPEGIAAADELATAVIQQNVNALHLIGHADPRGDRNHNLSLSRARAEAVKAYLLKRLAEKGMNADITTEGVGAEQPFDVSVLAYHPSQEEVWALDRRVEFARAGQ
jgi:outer membrane protein OmpA-like peptidoglycan-associated protein